MWSISVRRTVFATAMIFLGMTWRLFDLGNRGIWFDEAHSWQMAQFSWSKLLERVSLDVHPPLYFLILKLWIGLFGDSVFVMRLLSVAWFGVALVGVFMLFREEDAKEGSLSKSGTPSASGGGTIAIALLISSSFLFRYCQEVRMYTQEIAIFIFGSLFLLKAMRDGSRSLTWWFAYALTAAALAYTHNFGLLMLAAQGCYVALLSLLSLARSSNRTNSARWYIQFRGPIIAVVVFSALYIPWLPTLFAQRTRAVADFWTMSIEVESPLGLKYWCGLTFKCFVHNNSDIYNTYNYNDEIDFIISMGLLEMCAFASLLLIWKGGRLGRYLVTIIAVSLLLSVATSLNTQRGMNINRYFIVVYVCFLIGFAILLGRIASRVLKWGLVGILSSVMLFCTFQHQSTVNSRTGSGPGGAADYLAAESREGDAIVALHPFVYFPLKYHARGRFVVRQIRYPKLDIRHYTGSTLFDDSDFIDKSETFGIMHERVWVFGRRFDFDLLDTPSNWQIKEKTNFPEPIPFVREMDIYLLMPTTTAASNNAKADDFDSKRNGRSEESLP